LRRGALLALGWAWAAAIVWLSVTPSPPHIDVEQGDKLGHFFSYALLMFWFAMLYAKRSARLAHAAGFIAMGIALEFVQRALGYRSFELYDMVADALGVLAGWAAAALLPVRFPSR
jgi:VanZ family protein